MTKDISTPIFFVIDRIGRRVSTAIVRAGTAPIERHEVRLDQGSCRAISLTVAAKTAGFMAAQRQGSSSA
jgi:hypothetical protein